MLGSHLAVGEELGDVTLLKVYHRKQQTFKGVCLFVCYYMVYFFLIIILFIYNSAIAILSPPLHSFSSHSSCPSENAPSPPDPPMLPGVSSLWL